MGHVTLAFAGRAYSATTGQPQSQRARKGAAGTFISVLHEPSSRTCICVIMSAREMMTSRARSS
jgi:hypothetical protein